jgi:hypothetical protein
LDYLSFTGLSSVDYSGRQDHVNAIQEARRRPAASVCMIPVPKHQPTLPAATQRATIATTFFMTFSILVAFFYEM